MRFLPDFKISPSQGNDSDLQVVESSHCGHVCHSPQHSAPLVHVASTGALSGDGCFITTITVTQSQPGHTSNGRLYHLHTGGSRKALSSSRIYRKGWLYFAGWAAEQEIDRLFSVLTLQDPWSSTSYGKRLGP